ncbi:MAG: TolC family protein [Cyclobacteriaceae bacterium]
MKRIYSLALLTLVAIAGFGQQQFSLQQCIDYALENSIDVKNAVLDQRIAQARVNETIGIGLPQVSGDVSIIHNQKLPRFFTSYNPNGGFIDLSGVQGISEGDVVSLQNFFQLKSSGNAALTINQLIFNGSYLVGLQAATTFKELSEKSASQTREQVITNITKAYYGVLVNSESMKLFDVNIARVDSLFFTTKKLQENGFAERIDVDRVEVTLNNLKTERDKFEKLQQLTKELLKFQMNYPLDQEIVLTDELTEEMAAANLDGYLADWNYKNRPDYQVLETNRKLQNLNIKNNYAAALPTLAAFGNLGYSTQSPGVGGLFKTNTGIADDGVVGPDKWYSFSSFGLSLNIPIFSGLQRVHKIQQEKLTLQKIENGFKALERGIDIEIKTATINYENSQASLKSQRRNMELAENVARVTKIKYEQGVGSNLEVVDAEAALREAQINYYSSLYDALIAKTDLDKAFGKLVPVTDNN